MKQLNLIVRKAINTVAKSIKFLVIVLQLLTIPVLGQQIKINSGAFLNITGNAYIIVNNGDFVNNGTFTKGTETTTLTGNTAKLILGSSNTNFNNLSVTNTGGITTQLNQLSVNNLSITSGSVFNIDPTKEVIVYVDLTNSAGTAGLVIKSDVTGTASLIHNTNSVPATMERYISGIAEDWHFLSSPVSDQPIGGTWLPSGTYGNGTGYDLYIWDEASSCWVYNLNTTGTPNWPTVHPSDNFVSGKGYLYSVQVTNPTKQFVGNLNNGSLDYPVSFSSADASLKGFNLVGNPYPSSINWESSTGWTRTNLVSSGGGYDMWIWNPAANNYGVCNSYTGVVTNGVTKDIASMQGYFVRANSSGNLTLDNSVRVNSSTNTWFKSKIQENNSISISIISDEGYGSDEIIIDFGYSKNENGAIKLFSKVSYAPSLYLPTGNDKLSVRYLTNTNDNPLIPVTFMPGINGDYTISCDFDQTKFDTILLEDRKTNIIQDLKVKSTYRFYARASDDKNRFYLYFSSIENHSDSKFTPKVYTSQNQLIVDLSLVSNKTEIFIYDIFGRVLLHQSLNGNTQHSLNLKVNTQLLIVSLHNPDGKFCQKILWLNN